MAKTAAAGAVPMRPIMTARELNGVGGVTAGAI
jgi:hypothetical protein